MSANRFAEPFDFDRVQSMVHGWRAIAFFVALAACGGVPPLPDVGVPRRQPPSLRAPADAALVASFDFASLQSTFGRQLQGQIGVQMVDLEGIDRTRSLIVVIAALTDDEKA